MPLRFLCFSDTHGAVPRSSTEQVDGILHAGDIYSYASVSKKPQPPSPQGLLIAEWAKHGKVFSVRGNHDCADAASVFAATNEIDGRCVEAFPGVLLAGVGWHGEKYYELPTEREIGRVCDAAYRDYLRISKAGDQVVILTHYPCWLRSLYQYGKNPEGWMFETITDLARKTKAVAVVQGHVHELLGQSVRYADDSLDVLLAFPGPQGGILTLAEKNSFEFLPKQIGCQ